MTDTELAELKTCIDQRIRELESSLAYLTEETRPIEPSISLGRLTRMEAIGEKGINEHILSENQKTLERLGNALERLKHGSYGNCVRCGGEIPVERLRLVPETLVCVPCAEKKPR